MGNIAAAHWGHDSVISFYNAETDTFHVIELEKLTGIKHYRGHARLDEREDILRECLKISEEEFGIKNDYDFFILGSTTRMINYVDDEDPSILSGRVVDKIFNVKNYHINARHHNGHAYGAYAQSPWFGDETAIFTFDAGGDDGFTFLWDAVGDNVKSIQKPLWEDYDEPLIGYYGRNYNHAIGHGCVNIVNSTPSILDLAGKAMGAAAYGKTDTDFYNIGRRLFRYEFNMVNNRNPMWYSVWFEKYTSVTDRNEFSGKFFNSPEENNIFQIMMGKKHVRMEEEYDIAKGIQDEFETWVMKFLWENEDVIRKRKNRLVISGGCGLNVLLNRRIQREFGAEVFVPPDVIDSGLPFGFISRLMIKRGMKNSRRTITYAGPKIRDLNQLDDYKEKYNHFEISVEDLALRLKNDEIIGLIQGGIEVGPRALGNRSILCDPKGWDKKDKVNEIKRRELYRPFAPVCRREDAEKYFIADNYDNLSYMNFAVDVREEYAEQLAAITHVDNTARLQTVTEDQNKLLYNILSAFDGVLLNTSFNVRGKPILNTLQEAFMVLNESELDAVVLYHDEKLWYFNNEKI